MPVFLTSVNNLEKYAALDFLRSAVTSFVALLYTCHKTELLDEMTCLNNLYLRFILYLILLVIHGADALLIFTSFDRACSLQ